MREKNAIEGLSSELLIDAYWTAVRLGLDQEFIKILKNELARRGINIIARSEEN